MNFSDLTTTTVVAAFRTLEILTEKFTQARSSLYADERAGKPYVAPTSLPDYEKKAASEAAFMQVIMGFNEGNPITSENVKTLLSEAGTAFEASNPPVVLECWNNGRMTRMTPQSMWGRIEWEMKQSRWNGKFDVSSFVWLVGFALNGPDGQSLLNIMGENDDGGYILESAHLAYLKKEEEKGIERFAAQIAGEIGMPMSSVEFIDRVQSMIAGEDDCQQGLREDGLCATNMMPGRAAQNEWYDMQSSSQGRQGDLHRLLDWFQMQCPLTWARWEESQLVADVA